MLGVRDTSRPCLGLHDASVRHCRNRPKGDRPMRHAPPLPNLCSLLADRWCRALAVVLLLAAGGDSLAGGPSAPDATLAAFPGRNGLIAFASNRVTAANTEGDDEIFVMQPGGAGLRQLTRNAAPDSAPAW